MKIQNAWWLPLSIVDLWWTDLTCVQIRKISWKTYHSTGGTHTELNARCAQTARLQSKHSKKNLYVGLTSVINYSKGFIYSN